MTSENRITPGLITDLLDALERHGHDRSDDLHADRAIGLIGDLARIYQGTQDHPATAYPRTTPPSPPAYPGPSRHDAVTFTRADASTVFAALDIAADDKRYRVDMRPDCPGQSRPTCQTHLHDARAFDQMADRMLQAAQAAPAASASQPGPDRAASARRRQAGRPVTPSHRKPARPATGPAALPPDPWPPGGRAGHAGNRRTLRPAVPGPLAAPPGVRDRRRPAPRLAPGQPPSLAELLEAGPARTREPEPDLEAEP